MNWVKGNFPGLWKHILVWLLLVAPIAVYVNTFGTELSTEHARWGVMGDALSGIYGPILAVLTFFVLTRQWQLQAETTKHMHDQSHIQTANDDVAFYLSKLETILGQAHGNMPVGHLLEFDFQQVATLEQLRDPALFQCAVDFNKAYPQVYAAWQAYQGILSGLGGVGEYPYSNSYRAAQQRAIVVLSFATCVTLDQYVWCRCEGRLDGPYLFSPLLTGSLPTA